MMVTALLPDVEACAKVRDALVNSADLRYCRRLDEFVPLVQNSCADVLLVTPWDEHGMPMAPVVRQLRRRFPSLPVVIYCRLAVEDARELVSLVKAGADEVVFRGHDDLAHSIRTRLLNAGSHRVEADVLQAMGRSVPERIEPILAHCLQHARHPLSVEAVAGSLGVHRKTLVNRLSRAGLPSPSVLIAWSRLLVAARLLEDPGRSVEQVALAMGYGDGTALRNAFRRYTGLRPAEVRAKGGLRCVVLLFRRSVRASRERSAISSRATG